MHKGVLLAFRTAIETGEHSIELNGITTKDALYFEELAGIMRGQGFTITVEYVPDGGDHPTETDSISFDVKATPEEYGKGNYFSVDVFGEEYYVIKVSEDYLPTTSEELVVKRDFGDGEPSYDTIEVESLNEENTVFNYDELGLWGVTVSAGASADIGGIVVDFPSGGSWMLFMSIVGFDVGTVISYTNIVDETVEGISVKFPPAKTAYFAGENLNLAGLMMDITYSHYEGDEKVERQETLSGYELYDICEFSPAAGTSLSSGTTTVVATCGDASASFDVYAVATTTELSVTWGGIPEDELVLTTSQPENWAWNWNEYYEIDGQNYKPAGPVSWNTGYFPTWEENKYYQADGIILNPSQDSLARYYLILDGVVVDPRQEVTSITATVGNQEYSTTDSRLTKPLPYVYNGDWFYYAYGTYFYVVCIKKPGITVNVGGINATFDKAGTYFIQYRNNGTDGFVYTQSLVFTK